MWVCEHECPWRTEKGILELVPQAAVSCPDVCSGNQTRASGRAASTPDHTAISLALTMAPHIDTVPVFGADYQHQL